MQYHYVVVFDTETGKWAPENEATYFDDGNVWDDDRGWFVPVEEPFSRIDQDGFAILSNISSTWPAPDLEA